MKTKKIANIVFYKFYGNDDARKQACIFYNDGTVKSCSYDEGIDAVLEIVKEKKISTKEQLAEIINKQMVHVMSGYDFERRFDQYIVNEPQQNEDNFSELANERVIPVGPIPPKSDEVPTYQELAETDYEAEDDDKDIRELEHNEDNEELVNANREENPVSIVEQPVGNDSTDDTETDSNDEIISNDEENSNTESNSNNARVANRQNALQAANASPSRTKKKGFFSKIKNFCKKIKAKTVAIVLAVALALGGAGAAAVKNKGKIAKFFNNIAERLAPTTTNIKDSHLVYGDNNYYNDYNYNQLLKVNTNEVQKKAMQNIHVALVKFNKIFANKHLEEGKDIKAALSFTEAVSLQQAYNDYSNEEIAAIFNGSRINANELGQAYKNANLQLMGAHVIETREAPVDMSVLINSEEGKEFYNRYHEKFLQIKEATGQDKIDKLDSFRRDVLNDFPISSDIREVGISHADTRQIESYKLPVIPMIMATEIMYQNLTFDNTLNDQEIYYLNDVGLCNLAQDKFDRIERVTESAEEDNTQPLYEQYENAIVSSLVEAGDYVIDDAHRDLSQLDAFKNAVNNHDHEALSGTYSSGATSETYTTVDTNTVTTVSSREEKETIKTSDREEAVKEAGEQKVAEAEKKLDAQIAKENAEAQKKAELEAEERRKQLQAEADKQAQQMQQQVQQDYQDFLQDIEDANNQINQNNADNNTANDTPVNESDFGDHNVDFFDDYSDSNGNLDSSVQDITTDASNDMTNEALPDPNATGSVFEDSYPEVDENLFGDDSSYIPEYEYQDYYDAGADNESSQVIIEYEEPVNETPVETSISNEELADIIVENMANNPDTDYTEGYQYTY